MKRIILFAFLIAILTNSYAQKRSYLLFFDFKDGEIISSEDGTVDGILSLSKGKYDNTMVGVYSKSDETEKKTNPDGTPVLVKKNEVLNTTGIVEVKFNSENGQIMAGDYITTSSTPGVSMKATESGMVLGVALEDTKTNDGLVKIRILIQYLKQ